jgi:hypothetical protein
VRQPMTRYARPPSPFPQQAIEDVRPSRRHAVEGRGVELDDLDDKGGFKPPTCS